MTQAPTRTGDGLELAGVARDSAAGAVWTTVSRVTGLVRLVVIGAVLGPTFFGNLFQAANTLPNVIVYELLLGALVAPLLVPALVREVELGGPEAGGRLASGFLGAGLAVIAPVTCLLIGAGPLLVQLLTLGVQDGSTQRDLARSGWPLLAVLLPQVLLYFVAATAAAAQNARGRYALACAAPAVENVGVVATLLLVAAWTGGRPGEDPGLRVVLLLGVGTTASVALHAALQWWGARRVGVVLSPRPGWRDPAVRDVLRLAWPSLGYAGLSAARMVVVLVAAGAVQGGVVAFQVAVQLAVLPVALFSRPLAVALLPGLSRAHRRGDQARFRDGLVQGIRLYALLAVPAALGLVVLARPLASVLAAGEMSNPLGRALLAAAIAGLSLAVVGDGLFVLGTNASYARGDAASPLLSMALRAGIAVSGMALAVLLLDGWQVLLGVGASMALADLVASIHLTGRLLAALPQGRLPLLRPLVSTTTSAVVAVLPAIGIARMSEGASSRAQVLLLLVAVVLAVLLHMSLQSLRPGSDLNLLLRSLGAASPQVHSFDPDPARAQGLRASTHDGRASRPVPSRGGGPAPASPARPPRMRNGSRPGAGAALAAAGLLWVVAAAALSTIHPALGVALTVAFCLGLVVLVHPPAAAYLYLGLAPLVVGLDRGTVLPLARPNELLLLVLGVAAAIAVLRQRQTSPSPRSTYRPSAVDVALLLLVVTASLVPLLWLSARGLPLALDEVLYAMVPLKCVALYVLVRMVVRRPRQVGTALKVALASSAVVAVLALLQSLQVQPVFGLLATWYSPSGDPSVVDLGRGGSTIGSSIAVGDVMAVCAALSFARLARRQGSRAVSLGLALLFVLGAVGTGQFSAVLALVLTVLTVGVLTGSTRRVLLVGLPSLAAALALAWPVVQGRLSDLAAGSALPRSWTVRLENLEQYFWPRLFTGDHYLLGVTPAARVPEPKVASGYVWIESGHTWLLWTGGVPLLLSFLVLVVVALRRTARAVRAVSPEVSVAATAACASWVLVAVLTTFDPHLTMRGSADLLFPLLALAVVPVPLRPARGQVRGPASAIPAVQRGAPLLVKRFVDVVVASLALVVLAPLLVVLAALVKLEDRGPVLYRGRRVGVRGRPFTVLKFRSMRHGVGDRLHAEHLRTLVLSPSPPSASGGSVKIAGDPRVTRIGAVLRRLSLDELPQLINVVAGDMSLVGPRPEVPYALDCYRPEDLRRFSVLPGMTGLWQVSGRSRLNQREMLELDCSYARSWSVRQDCVLLLRTPSALLRGDGAR